MHIGPAPSLRDRIRGFLGTDQIASLHRRLDAQEATMTTMLDLLNGLVSKTTEASAAQQASFLNIHNALNRQGEQITDLQRQLREALENQGEVTPEMQAKADEIAQSLADIKRGAETADDGFEPVEVPDEDGDVIATPDVAAEQAPVANPVEGAGTQRQG